MNGAPLTSNPQRLKNELVNYRTNRSHHGLDGDAYEDDRRMKPKFQNVLGMCIQQGIAFGYARAYKHTEKPTEADLKREIEQEIWNEIWEWFEIGGNDD